MLRSILIGIMLLAFALSGCMDAPDDEGDDGAGDDTGTGVGGGFDSDGNFTGGGNASVGGSTEAVVLLDYPDELNGTEAATVSWSVDLAAASAEGNASDDNDTGAGASANTSNEIEETGLAWGFTSVAVPTDPDDYDNVTGVVNNTTSPGEFDAELTVEGDGTSVFIRAYAVSGGEYFWSEEVELNYTAGSAGEAGAADYEILIQPGTGGLAQFAKFDSTDLKILVGDSVVWNNTDSGTHDIKITGTDFEHETGDLAEGDVSDPVIFLAAGEYEFECTNHGTMNGGTITVE